jgi:hypothetical protein
MLENYMQTCLSCSVPLSERMQVELAHTIYLVRKVEAVGQHQNEFLRYNLYITRN